MAQTLQARERRLATLIPALDMDPLPVDRSVAEAWARLRVWLREASRRMPVNDSWIAATAIAAGAAVITQDDDYEGLDRSQLEVIKI